MPGIFQSFIQGQNAGQQSTQNRLQNLLTQRGMDDRNRLQELLGGIAQGDRNAIAEASVLSPQITQSITQSIARMDNNQRQRTAQEAELSSQALSRATPENFDFVLDHLKSQGVEGYEQYRGKPEALPLLKQIVKFTKGQAKPQSPLGKLIVDQQKFPEQKQLFDQRIAKENAPSKPLVSITNEAEKEESKARAKDRVKNFSTIRDRASAAEDNLQQLHIAKNIDVTTGALEPLKNSVAAFAQGLGFDPANIGLDKADNAQSFVGIMQNLVLTKMQAQKGPQTENDAKRIENTVARLGGTAEANQFLIDAGIALEERRIEQRNFFLEWEKEKGGFKGAEIAWNKHKRSTPLIGRNPKTGRPIFVNQYLKAMREANPQASDKEILNLWRSKYKR